MDSVELVELGTDSGRGNLLGVQPELTQHEYASEEALFAKLDGYLRQAARGRGWIGPKTIAVFPEHIGTWLSSTGAGRAVEDAPTLTGAMSRLALSDPLRLIFNLLSAREKNRARAAFLRLRAKTMAAHYTAVFSRLARTHAVTVVGGSIALPAPRVEADQVVAGAGPIYAASAVFKPDGAPYPDLVRKSFPTAEENPFMAGAPVAETRAFETPAGRLGVLICADAWYPEPYAALRRVGAEVVAVPSFIESAGLWDSPWKGYSGNPPPPGVDLGDIGRLTEGEARHKYSLGGRLAESGARRGLAIFLRGTLWDIVADSGTAVGLRDGEVRFAGQAGGALLNLWL